VSYKAKRARRECRYQTSLCYCIGSSNRPGCCCFEEIETTTEKEGRFGHRHQTPQAFEISPNMRNIVVLHRDGYGDDNESCLPFCQIVAPVPAYQASTTKSSTAHSQQRRDLVVQVASRDGWFKSICWPNVDILAAGLADGRRGRSGRGFGWSSIFQQTNDEESGCGAVGDFEAMVGTADEPWSSLPCTLFRPPPLNVKTGRGHTRRWLRQYTEQRKSVYVHRWAKEANTAVAPKTFWPHLGAGSCRKRAPPPIINHIDDTNRCTYSNCQLAVPSHFSPRNVLSPERVN